MTPTPIYPIVEKFVNDEYKRLENAQITPWAFFNSSGVRLNDFYGKPIAIGPGIRFYGSSEVVFWSGYIEPFLKDIAFRAIDQSMKAAAERRIPLHQPLLEVQGQLHSLCRRTFGRMADITGACAAMASPTRFSFARRTMNWRVCTNSSISESTLRFGRFRPRRVALRG